MDLGSWPQAAASIPACVHDASRRLAGTPPFSGCLKIRQRKQTADWQFWFSDRFTGARNPARLTSSIPSRRIRYAPFQCCGGLPVREASSKRIARRSGRAKGSEGGLRSVARRAQRRRHAEWRRCARWPRRFLE
jgi:hypothetical protein